MAPRFLQAFEEEVRSAQQQDLGHRCVAARERRQILVDDGLKERGDDLLDRDAGLEKRVRVGFGKDATFAADFVERIPLVAHLRELLQRDLKLARRLLDERARAARAGALHQDLLPLGLAVAREEDRLHVLTADLAHEPNSRMQPLDSRRHGDDLLDYPSTQERGDDASARSREEETISSRPQAMLPLQTDEEFQDLLRLPRVVPLVGTGQDLSVRGRQNVFARRTAHVHTADHHHLPSVPTPLIEGAHRILRARWAT